MSEVVFHRLDLDAALDALRRYACDELGRRPEVREVVLIGSLVRGDWSGSDADVVVIIDTADDRGPFRSQAYAPERHPGLLVYTPSERREWSPRFADEVARGMVLYRR